MSSMGYNSIARSIVKSYVMNTTTLMLCYRNIQSSLQSCPVCGPTLESLYTLSSLHIISELIQPWHHPSYNTSKSNSPARPCLAQSLYTLTYQTPAPTSQSCIPPLSKQSFAQRISLDHHWTASKTIRVGDCFLVAIALVWIRLRQARRLIQDGADWRCGMLRCPVYKSDGAFVITVKTIDLRPWERKLAMTHLVLLHGVAQYRGAQIVHLWVLGDRVAMLQYVSLKIFHSRRKRTLIQ